MPDINKTVEWAVNIAKDNTHGYDQVYRQGKDYDCSSLIANALIQGGFNVSRETWTGNLEKQLIANGFKKCTKPWKKGDIHLNKAHHVVMSVDSYNVVTASINEKGTTKGGKTGDQTGREIYVKPYYEYSRGWDCHYRYTGNNSTIGYIVGNTYTVCVNNLNVRSAPDGLIKSKSQLTQNARKYCNSLGQLMNGTRVTCQETRVHNGNIWMKIPSGWICANYNGKEYVK